MLTNIQTTIPANTESRNIIMIAGQQPASDVIMAFVLSNSANGSRTMNADPGLLIIETNLNSD